MQSLSPSELLERKELQESFDAFIRFLQNSKKLKDRNLKITVAKLLKDHDMLWLDPKNYLSVSEVADELNLSRSHVSRLKSPLELLSLARDWQSYDIKNSEAFIKLLETILQEQEAKRGRA